MSSPPSSECFAAIGRLDHMAAFLHAWTQEAALRACAGDQDGAVAALKGLEALLAVMAGLYRDSVLGQ